MTGVILIDDNRYKFTQNYLTARGYVFSAVKNPDFIIFPFKEAIDETIYSEDFFAALNKNTLIFSGIKNEYVADKCDKFGLLYYIMMDDKMVAFKNSIPTSEGVLSYLIANRTETIAGSKILVIGYGICGRDLGKRLKALNANVFALVRNLEKELNAYCDGIMPIYLSDLKYPSDFDVIINTVPMQTLTNDIIDNTKGVLLIDIASAPYGFDIEYAKKMNDKSAVLPGLPGKFAIKTAGEILGEFIEDILSRRN